MYINYDILYIYYILYIIYHYKYYDVSCTTSRCHITSMIPLSKCLSSLSSLSDFLLARRTPVAATKCQGKHQELGVEPKRGGQHGSNHLEMGISTCVQYTYVYIYTQYHPISKVRCEPNIWNLNTNRFTTLSDSRGVLLEFDLQRALCFFGLPL